MTKHYSIPRGTADILPEGIGRWQKIESDSRNLLSCWGYREIRTPIFEETELFARSMGQTSDIVQKQMLNLASQKEDSGPGANFSLRPEGTAAIVRAYIQNDLDKKENLSKLFYLGPMFRGERPQKGRLRQFHQIGAEAIGPNSASPFLDAEMIALAVGLLHQAGLKENQFLIKINTLGSPEDKENFSKFLRGQLHSKTQDLCPDCQNRLERNVFRVLDCKNKTCKDIVAKLKLDHSYLSEESCKYFSDVQDALRSLGVQFEVSKTLVRGLDYYTHTVFEISSPDLGSQDALGAGGRYGSLVSQLGGPDVDAIGFALGIERILLALGESKAQEQGLDAVFISLDEHSLKANFNLIQKVRAAGLSADMSFKLGSMKSQMRLADKMKARFCVILGENELNQGVVAVKNMGDGSQEQIDINSIDKLIKKLQK